MRDSRLTTLGAKGAALLLSLGMLVFAVAHGQGCRQAANEAPPPEEPANTLPVAVEPDEEPETSAGESEAEAATPELDEEAFLPATKSGGFLPLTEDEVSAMQQAVVPNQNDEAQEQAPSNR